MSKSEVEQFQEFSDSVKRGLVDGIKEDKAGYALLVERVREVDAEAANWMNFQAPMLAGFMYHGMLAHAFHWSLTPQGQDFWMDIWAKLD